MKRHVLMHFQMFVPRKDGGRRLSTAIGPSSESTSPMSKPGRADARVGGGAPAVSASRDTRSAHRSGANDRRCASGGCAYPDWPKSVLTKIECRILFLNLEKKRLIGQEAILSYRILI